jgi:hypothetical protein
MASQDREILERAVRLVAEQAAAASHLIDEALDGGLDGSHPVTLQAKMLRLELLNVKADLERELGKLVMECLSNLAEVNELVVARNAILTAGDLEAARRMSEGESI